VEKCPGRHWESFFRGGFKADNIKRKKEAVRRKKKNNYS
jgi:hypothetical protein